MKTTAQRQAELRERRAKRGLKMISVFAPERDREKVKDFARQLCENFETSQTSAKTEAQP